MTLQLGSFEARKLIANEIAVLEGRLEEAGFEFRSDDVMAVSYTHLDVYKRQGSFHRLGRVYSED